MKTMQKALVVLSVSLCLAGVATSQTPGKQESAAEIQKEVIAADNARYEAMAKLDMAALDRLHGDEFIFVNTKGKMLNKAEYLEEIRSGALKFMSVNTDDYHFSIYGDTVVMNGRATSVVEYHGVVNKQPRRFTSVFVKMQGQWRLVAHQATLIPSE